MEEAQVSYQALADGIPDCPARVAVLGIGNELNGDDAAGVLVIRRLREIVQQSREIERGVLLLEGGTAPENFTGSLRRFQPELIIMVDAAHLGARPGAVAWLDWQTVDGFSAATHGLPPSVLVKYLSGELHCRIGLIGIQPDHLDFDRPVSEAVAAAIDQVANQLAGWLSF